MTGPGPETGTGPGGTLTWNRNKRSVCLDLRRPEGLDVALALVDRADVVMENYRPGVADAMGIGPVEVLGVEVPMLHALAFGLTTRVGAYFATREDPGRYGSQHSQVVPYQAFRTKDGHVVAGTWGDDGWQRFCEGIDWPELAADDRFATNVRRVARRDELVALLHRRFEERTTAEWDARLAAMGVLAAPVNTFSDLFGHPQAAALGLTVEVDHPTAGRQRQVAPAVRLDAAPGSVRRPPPLLGEHTREVLEELGLGAGEVDRLLAAGVAADPAGSGLAGSGAETVADPPAT